jgi:hypothetical protein
METTHSNCANPSFLPPPTTTDILGWLKSERAVILRGVSHALEACDALLAQIGSFNYSVDSRELLLLPDASHANRQVQRWLERLHDRRILLEERLRGKREEVEEVLAGGSLEHDLLEVESAVEGLRMRVEGVTLGKDFRTAEDEERGLNEIESVLKVGVVFALRILASTG